MTSNNKTFMEKAKNEISCNVSKCRKSILDCCENSYQRMHFELTKTNLDNKNRYRNLNLDYSSVYFDDEDEEDFDDHLLNNIYGVDNLKLYSGYHNIWFPFNKIRFFNNAEPNNNTINVIKPRMGYCIISRSCTKFDILAKCCFNLKGYRLTNKSNIKVGDIVFCKYRDWRYFCLGVIKRLRDNLNGDKIIDLVFSCCPDSELVLAWHFNSSIEKNRSLLKYNLPNYNLIDTGEKKYQPELEPIQEEKTSVAAFLFDEELENEIPENEILGAPKLNENDYEKFSSPFFSKKTYNNNEIIKFNTFWVNDNIYGKNFFKRKQIIVSSREDVNNIFTDCLSNVKIISEYHMRNILNIHQRKRDSLKIIKTNEENMVMNMLEPQELAFFKQNKNYSRISTALSNGFYCTYTGTLCNKAKHYLLTNCQ